MNTKQNRHVGFTLIELLIVVLIIAILAAIAVPNFLEFQTRAKVSRVVSDMRSVALGIEAYYVDNNEYPLSAVDAPFGDSFSVNEYINCVYAQITTPIAYMSTFPADVFGEKKFFDAETRKFIDYRRTFESGFGNSSTLNEIASGGTFNINPTAATTGWILFSLGPDAEQNINTGTANGGTTNVGKFGDPVADWAIYDPTNGTVSIGDIVRSSRATDSTGFFSFYAK